MMRMQSATNIGYEYFIIPVAHSLKETNYNAKRLDKIEWISV
jgi:hypothetical protein